MKFTPYSHSRIKKFDACKQAFEYSYIKNKDSPENSAISQVGSGIHEFMELYVRHLYKTKSQTDLERATEIIDEVASRYVRQDVVDEIMDECARIRDWYFLPPEHLEYPHFGFETKKAIDATGKVCDYDDPNAVFRIIVDRWWVDLDNVLHVVDYKSGFAVVDIKKTDQIKLYAHVILKYLESISVEHDGAIEIEIWNMRFRRPPSTETVSAAQCAETYEKFFAKTEAIEAATEYPGEPNDNCEYCEHRSYCSTLLSASGPSLAVAKYLQAKLNVSEMQKSLKAHVKKNGNIMFEGRMFGAYSGQPTTSWNGKASWDWVLQNSGNDEGALSLLFEAFHMNEATGLKIAKRLGISPEELLAVSDKKPRNSFGFLPDE